MRSTFRDLRDKIVPDGWKVRYRNDLTDGDYGACTADYDTMEADISFKPGLEGEELVRTIIHELLHVATSRVRCSEHIRKHVSDKAFKIITKEIERREEELVLHLEDVIHSIYEKK